MVSCDVGQSMQVHLQGIASHLMHVLENRLIEILVFCLGAEVGVAYVNTFHTKVMIAVVRVVRFQPDCFTEFNSLLFVEHVLVSFCVCCAWWRIKVGREDWI